MPPNTKMVVDIRQGRCGVCGATLDMRGPGDSVVTPEVHAPRFGSIWLMAGSTAQGSGIGGLTECPCCGVFVHDDCWAFSGGCPTFGCAASSTTDTTGSMGAARALQQTDHEFTQPALAAPSPGVGREPGWGEFLAVYALFGLSAAPCCCLVAGFTISDIVAWSTEAFLTVSIVGSVLLFAVPRKGGS